MEQKIIKISSTKKLNNEIVELKRKINILCCFPKSDEATQIKMYNFLDQRKSLYLFKGNSIDSKGRIIVDKISK